MAIITRQDAINACLELTGVYEDYPFEDTNWTLMRHKANQKVFAWIFEREGHIWINLKGKPEWCDFMRQVHKSVVPAYHLNKTHWNSVILDGTVSDDDIRMMVEESYKLTRPKIRKNSVAGK